MVETITPGVLGRRRYLTAAVLHALGAGASGAAVGTLLGGIGWLVGAPWHGAGYVALAFVATVYFLREAAGVPVPLPQLRRQVPEWWRRFYSAPTAAALYGVGLGVGFLTYLSFGTYAAVATGAFVSGSVSLGALVGGTFGLTRAVAAAVGAGTRDEEAGARIADRLGAMSGSRWPKVVNAGVLAGVAAASVIGVG
ncbi:MAG TPA: hypothetical protein VM784_02245 [Actinomycetota bacterium]|nr:hypothetical protein [Actinomycetota bacterium]